MWGVRERALNVEQPAAPSLALLNQHARERAAHCNHHHLCDPQSSVYGNDRASARVLCSHRGAPTTATPPAADVRFCPQGLIDCPQIIVADGVSIAEKSELKKGRVTAALAARYSQYLQLLRDALEAEAAQLQVQVPQQPAAFGPLSALRSAC